MNGQYCYCDCEIINISLRNRLYVSPKLPPTPVQKKITPRQWLSEGRDKKGSGEDGLPSLDDVRKSLLYNIEEAENLSEMSRSYPTTSGQEITSLLSLYWMFSSHTVCYADTKKRLLSGNKKPQRKHFIHI